MYFVYYYRRSSLFSSSFELGARSCLSELLQTKPNRTEVLNMGSIFIRLFIYEEIVLSGYLVYT